jgi:hypothetical protein
MTAETLIEWLSRSLGEFGIWGVFIDGILSENT